MRFLRQGVCCFAFLFFMTTATWAEESEVKMLVSEAPQKSEETVTLGDVEVINVSGDVDVCDADDKNCEKPEEGMMLEAGSKIHTKTDASIELGFDEEQKNVVRIEAGSDASVLLNGDEKMILENGEVFAAIKDLPQGTAFEIKTPTVVSGARGTEWTTKVDSEGTVVEAFDDNSFVKSLGEDGKPKGEEVMVFSGHMTIIKRFQAPAPLVKIPEARQQRWQSLRGEVRQHVAHVMAKERVPNEMRKRGPMSFQQKERFQERINKGAGGGRFNKGSAGERQEGRGKGLAPKKDGFGLRNGDQRQPKGLLDSKERTRGIMGSEVMRQGADRFDRVSRGNDRSFKAIKDVGQQRIKTRDVAPVSKGVGEERGLRVERQQIRKADNPNMKAPVRQIHAGSARPGGDRKVSMPLSRPRGAVSTLRK